MAMETDCGGECYYSGFDVREGEDVQRTTERNLIEASECSCPYHEWNGCHCSQCCTCDCHNVRWLAKQEKEKIHTDFEKIVMKGEF